MSSKVNLLESLVCSKTRATARCGHSLCDASRIGWAAAAADARESCDGARPLHSSTRQLVVGLDWGIAPSGGGGGGGGEAKVFGTEMVARQTGKPAESKLDSNLQLPLVVAGSAIRIIHLRYNPREGSPDDADADAEDDDVDDDYDYDYDYDYDARFSLSHTPLCRAPSLSGSPICLVAEPIQDQT